MAAISIFSSGTFATTLSTDAQDVAGIDGSIGDVVSGPHAIAFTHDGALALVVDSNSEDVLAVSSARVEAALARPLPGHLPEGIAIAPDDSDLMVLWANTLNGAGHIEALEKADAGDMRPLIAIFVESQRTALIEASEIASDVNPITSTKDAVAAARDDMVIMGAPRVEERRNVSLSC